VRSPGDWPVNFDEKATVSVANLLVTFVIADGISGPMHRK
jgi:hypothetical protein